MLKVYGSMLCPDCLECRSALDAARVGYEYLDFGDSLLNLKAFLKIRDQDPLFTQVKEDGKIGIPCIVSEDGTVSLDWSVYVSQGNA